MSTFSKRTSVSNTIIQYMEKYYWQIIENTFPLAHAPYGYETHISDKAKDFLRGDYSKTAKLIRFTPDYIVIRQFPDRSYRTILLEYKVTRTPRFILGDEQWFQGQIEADAWENYMNYGKLGIETAILIYCPYHPRPLLCDFPKTSWLTHDRQRTGRSRGSGTDYVNISLNKLRTFDEFMEEEFKIPKGVTAGLLHGDFFEILRNEPQLQIDHHYRSRFQHVQTGDNWLPRYKQ